MRSIKESKKILFETFQQFDYEPLSNQCSESSDLEKPSHEMQENIALRNLHSRENVNDKYEGF